MVNEAMLPYSIFLVISGLLLSVAERFWPRRPQRVLRRGYLMDWLLLFLNAEIVGALVAIWLAQQIPYKVVAAWREQMGLTWIGQQAIWLQLVMLLVTKDLLQWCVHYAMHHVPYLWVFHRTHHSTEEMDWLSNWRFHWVEILVYQTVLYVPATLVGVSGEAAYGCAIVSTTLGHFAHANLRWDIGPLKYIFNSPGMHAWHHVHPDHGPENRNFGISLALWDWLFGTAYVPKEAPARLGLRENEGARVLV